MNSMEEKYALMNSIRDMQNKGYYVWEIARKLRGFIPSLFMRFLAIRKNYIPYYREP